MTVTIRAKDGTWLGQIYDVTAVTQYTPNGCIFFESANGLLRAGLDPDRINHDFPSVQSPVTMDDFFPQEAV